MSERLQAVTTAFAALHTPEDLFRVILTPALEALNAIAGALLMVDETGTQLKIAALQGYEQGTQTLWQDGPLDSTVPAGDALARELPLFFEHQGALLQAYPELEARTGGMAAVATAVLPMLLDGQPLGAIILDFKEPHHFTVEEERFLLTLAAQSAVALGRARLAQTLEARVAARTAELDEQRAALDAFVAYKEAVGSESDVLALARQAVGVVHANLNHVSVAYYELEDELWKARVWSDDLQPEVAAEIQAGVPQDAPDFSEAARSGAAVFVDGWDAEANAVPSAAAYGAVAFLPLVVNGETRSLFVVGTREARVWSPREQALVRAVARGLNITLERTEVTRQLKAQNAELEARTRALEGFAELTQDLALRGDPYEVVRRAQKVTLSLLNSGYALYYEREGAHWRNRVQVGDVGNADLQTFIDAGPLVGVTPSLDLPWATQQPYYQDEYARGSDTPAAMVQHVTTAASLPVCRGHEVVGVFIAVLFDARRWTPTDKVVLETVVRSLGLALERAEQAGELQQRTRQLERSNAELEQFAYIASHDLQAPIRAVTSFAGILDRKYGGALDDRGRVYLRQIVDGGEHMKRLVDDLLTFSRVHTEQREGGPVEVGGIVDSVIQRLQTEIQDAHLNRTALPVVKADARQVDQLFQNLISNGLKYRRDGVTPRVHVSAEQDGPVWRFAVSDNGIGIEAQYFERIFVIFQRLHGRDTYEGTGIGLAVCKKIVERHGGQLWLESTPGEGSTFFFTLPAVEG